MTTWRDRIDTVVGGLVAGAGIALGVALSLWIVSALVIGSVTIGQWLERIT